MLRDLWSGLHAVAGAALLSQGPEFIQQYQQRLGGHLDEARLMLKQVPALAARVAELTQAHDALAKSQGFAKPWMLARHLQADIAWTALGNFRPAAPLTLEGVYYASLGLVLAVGLAWLHLALWRKILARLGMWANP